jgi:hypothetical protein
LAIYPIINKETGEQKEVSMSVHDWAQWCKDNSQWSRDWSDPTSAPSNISEVGEWREKLVKKNPGWNEVLSKAGKSAGSQNKIGKI